EILNQSLNTGAVYVARKLGNERFSDYMLSFGFGEKTGIDLPSETVGLVKNLKSNRDIEVATASFGQGFAVTPIAIARALSALANGGMLITPHVVNYIDYKEALRLDTPEKNAELPKVISKEASEGITRMLVQVVDKALLGGTVKMPDFSIAAKTGTAQIADSRGGYYDDRFLHTFFGYFPAYDPKFLVFLYLKEPKNVRFASETLTNPFIDIVNFLIHYYQVPPDR
ncbi:MAG: penicillin-binding transpeptidase domain-containing protein, partial [bacterium]|nr:penicillin-binding transpeptidase domain-containing protein [bacterium]